MLALTFADKDDYDKIQETDICAIVGLTTFSPGSEISLVVHHASGSSDIIPLNNTYKTAQIEWFKAGSALNVIRNS